MKKFLLTFVFSVLLAAVFFYGSQLLREYKSQKISKSIESYLQEDEIKNKVIQSEKLNKSIKCNLDVVSEEQLQKLIDENNKNESSKFALRVYGNGLEESSDCGF